MRILVTGGAGFIGNTLALRLVEEGHEVVVVDNVNGYYDPSLKETRLARLPESVTVHRVDIVDLEALRAVFAKEGPFDAVAHLAAQAGVRYSLEHPEAYAQTNYMGTQNVLECVRQYGQPHLVFASTSSVYGKNPELPYREDMRVDEPVSIYAASKRAGELLAYSYHTLFDLNVSALRFFTVYGPWGRPDMAFFSFTKAIIEGTTIELFNGGDMQRDFTYVDDIVAGFMQALTRQLPGYEILNLGHGTSVHLRDFLSIIEREVGKKAVTVDKPMQPGDVPATFADTSKAKRLLGFEPKVSVDVGVKRFVAWYKEYYGT
jgi:UDP-glucuronate 4-epimerase